MESNTALTDQMKISAKIVSLDHQAILRASSQKPFQYLNYFKIYKKCLVCFIVDTGPKSYQSSKHGTDIQTEAAAQTPSEIQLTDIPKPEQHQHYGFDNQGNA